MGVREPKAGGRLGALRTFVAVGLVASTIAVTNSSPPLTQVPAGTHVRFRLTAPLSSNESKSGQPFTFVLLEPILVDAKVIAATGATGSGMLILAGPAGSKGHEGDLTLRIDSVPTADGGRLVFDDQRFEVNGVNEKVASALAGFIPFVGFFAQFMRGKDERISVNDAIQTTLVRPANIVAPPPVCTPPSPTSSPSSTPSASASAPASATPSQSPAPPAETPTPCIPPPPCAPPTPPEVASAVPSPITSASPSETPEPTPTPSPCVPLPPCAPAVTPAASGSPPASPAPADSSLPSPLPSPTPAAWVTPYRYVAPSGPVVPITPAPVKASPAATPTKAR